PFELAGELGGQQPPQTAAAAVFDLPGLSRIGGHTVIGLVATNARLDKAQAQRVAIMAHDGLARAVRPAHTPFDGDIVFVAATERLDLSEPAPLALARIGAIAADCVARAIARAVYAADDLGDIRSYRSMIAGAQAG